MKGAKTRVPRGYRAARGGHRRTALLACYALWVALVLTASTPYLAETGSRKVLEDGSFSYAPTFYSDGPIEHYVVQRADNSENGSIDIDYDEDTRVVQLQAKNIAELTVDCRSIAKEKNREILGDDFTDQDLVNQYFNDLGWLHVHTSSTHSIQITWKHMPVPEAVVADDEEYLKNWNRDGSDIEILVPQGEHHYILFFMDLPKFPTAVIDVEHTVTLVNDELVFDGSRSIGGETELEKIEDYLWDFDTSDEDPIDEEGAKVRNAFGSAGTYTVSLTVRNGYGMRDTATRDITVDKQNPGIDIDGDGKPDWSDDDDDDDGFLDSVDDFPEDPAAHLDTDGDGFPDELDGNSTTGLVEDDDDDDDGVPDLQDGDPTDPLVGAVGTGKEKETDGDGSTDMTMVLLILMIVIVALVIAAGVMRARSGEEAEPEVEADTMGDWVDIKGYGPDERVNEGKKGKKQAVEPKEAGKRKKRDRVGCPSCGASVKAGSETCMYCGTDIPAAGERPTEKKHATSEKAAAANGAEEAEGAEEAGKAPPEEGETEGGPEREAQEWDAGEEEGDVGEEEGDAGEEEGGGLTECPVCAAPLEAGAEECPDCGEDLTSLAGGGDDDWGGGKDDWGAND